MLIFPGSQNQFLLYSLPISKQAALQIFNHGHRLFYLCLSPGKAQTIKIVPDAPSMKAYNGIPYIYNNMLSIQCIKNNPNQNNGYYQLGLFDGNNISLKPEPANVQNNHIQAYGGDPLAYNNNLYLNYTVLNASSGYYQLAQYDNSIVKLLPGPNTDYSDMNFGPKIIYQKKLYFCTNVGIHNYHLCAYDGQTYKVIPNPTEYGSVETRYHIIYKNKLYFTYTTIDRSGGAIAVQLASYDGNNIILYPMPLTARFSGGPFAEYHGNLYFPYRYLNSNATIARFDGTAVSLVPNPDNGVYTGSSIIYNDTLFIQYGKGNIKYLAKFDGTTVSIIPNPNNSPGYNLTYGEAPVIYNNKLYISYQNFGPVFQLAEYTGSSLKLIPNPDGGAGYFGAPLVYNNKLYLGYATKFHGPHIGVFNGSDLKLIPDLGSPGGLYAIPSFINYQNKLYFNYAQHLGYLD